VPDPVYNRAWVTSLPISLSGDDMNELEKAQAMIGQKQMQLEFMNGEFNKLIDLLADLKDGTRSLESIQVDRLNRSCKWEATPNPVGNGEANRIAEHL
jgi:hypothetical protein